MRYAGFIGPSYTLQSVNVDCQRTVNLFPEINALGTGKSREVASLVPTPGLRLLLTLPASPVRGLWRSSVDAPYALYAVGGNKLYGISSSWVATELGSLNSSTGPVSMADNGEHLVVVDGQYGYAYTFDSTTFAGITDPDFLGADQVAYLDGYFIFNRINSGQFFFSGLNGITFDALDIGTAEGSPDNLVGIITSHQNVHLFGTQSIEVYYDSGDVDDPFQRIQGAVVDVGCSAAFTIARLANAVYFMGGDENGSGVIYRLNGYQAERISTSAIESVIRGLDQTTIGDARAWTYQQGGHAFYCLNLPGYDSTFVYDATTNMWHERTYTGLWGLERHRAECHASAFSTNVVGDYDNGNIYALDPETLTDNGTSITRDRISPHLSEDEVRIFHNSFMLDMETGVGTATGQGLDPQVMLRYSDDHGHTWSNERWKSAGAQGKRKTRVKFNRLGASRDRVYWIRITDPVKVVLVGAELETSKGAA